MKVPAALIGSHVDRTAFDDQVRVSFCALDPNEGYRVDAELVIETPFFLRDRDGAWHELDPAPDPASRPLNLFRHIVTAIEIRGHGALHLTFKDGAELHVGPHPQYESWRLTGIGVEPIRVGPGGTTDWQSP